MTEHTRDVGGTTQKEVANALGVSHQYVAQIERSALKKLAALCRWYGINPGDLEPCPDEQRRVRG